MTPVLRGNSLSSDKRGIDPPRGAPSGATAFIEKGYGGNNPLHHIHSVK